MKKLPQVFILHGWSMDSNLPEKWRPFQEALERMGIGSTLLRLPGFLSPLTSVWQLSDYVAWLSKELPTDEPVCLLGHSFGGQLALRFTALHKERVQRLILVDSSGLRDHRFLARVKRRFFLIAAKLGKILFPFAIFRTLLYKLARERDYQMAPPLLRRTMSLVLDDEVIHDLPLIRVPTLLLWGEHDEVTPPRLGKTLLAGIQGAVWHEIVDARHCPPYTHPEEVAAAVSAFVHQGNHDLE